jgi:hypothetical protein
MRFVRWIFLTFAVPVAVLLPAGSALALSYPVTSTADTESKGTLRASIKEAEAHTGPDSIPVQATGTIALGSALPAIGDDVTITGPGADSLTITRSGSAPPFRIFYFSGATTTVSGLTVTGGVEASGAGIQSSSGDLTLIRVVVTGNEAFSEGGGTRYATGGGILNVGTLTLRESSVIGNTAIAKGGDENVAAGAGIESEGTLFVERSTISGNLARASAGTGGKSNAVGGGLALASGFATIEESTISGNTVLAEDASQSTIARGGGVWGSGLTITSSTIAGNAAEIDESATLNRDVAGDNLDVGALIRDSIVADSLGEGESCANPLTSGGFNLDDEGSCGFAKSSDLVGVVAGLDPVLKDNGGPTPTHALLPGSIAIDRGNSFGATIDQRGLPRPSDFAEVSNKEGGDGSDVGAFELQVPPPPAGGGGPVLVSQVPADREPPNTRIVKGPPRDGYQHKAKFRFVSTEAQSTFQCKVDLKPWRGCRNPYKRTVGPGKHVFKVRAIDRFGNVDPTPARFGWRVKLLGR